MIIMHLSEVVACPDLVALQGPSQLVNVIIVIIDPSTDFVWVTVEMFGLTIVFVEWDVRPLLDSQRSQSVVMVCLLVPITLVVFVIKKLDVVGSYVDVISSKDVIELSKKVEDISRSVEEVVLEIGFEELEVWSEVEMDEFMEDLLVVGFDDDTLESGVYVCEIPEL